MLVFAYDASLHGDWVAHYAIRFAASGAPRQLRLVHVEDQPPADHLPACLARIAAECAALDVELETRVVARGKADVSDRILELTPAGATVITGTRARPRARSFLAGTSSARLLAALDVGVIALHIVAPGILGQPGRVLLPVLDRAPVAARALPLLRLLGADLDRLHVAAVRTRSPLQARFGSVNRLARLLVDDARHLAAVEHDLRLGLAPHHPHLDGSVTATTDDAREIALLAARHHARLICLDAEPSPAPRHPAPGAHLERVLRIAPADVAIYHPPPGIVS